MTVGERTGAQGRPDTPEARPTRGRAEGPDARCARRQYGGAGAFLVSGEAGPRVSPGPGGRPCEGTLPPRRQGGSESPSEARTGLSGWSRRRNPRPLSLSETRPESLESEGLHRDRTEPLPGRAYPVSALSTGAAPPSPESRDRPRRVPRGRGGSPAVLGGTSDLAPPQGPPGGVFDSRG